MRRYFSHRGRIVLVLFLAGGVALLVLGILLAALAGVLTMPSYLAAWVFIAAIPFGALPVVMVIDLAGPVSMPLFAGALRRQLLFAPVAALFAIPLLFRVRELFFHGTALSTPFAQFWMAPPHYIIRVILYLIVWTALAVVFAFAPVYPRTGRRALAALGLMMHFAISMLAAVDFVMAVEPKWTSAMFGLIFMATQTVIALTVAALRAGTAWRPGTERLGIALIIMISLWMFVQYTQFEAIWSADLPSEITWYIHRDAGGGHIAEWLGFIGGFLIPLVLLTLRRPGSLTVAVWVLLLVQLLDVWWLITPAFRATFILKGIDFVEMLGLLGIASGAMLLLDLVASERNPFRRPFFGRRVRHG